MAFQSGLFKAEWTSERLSLAIAAAGRRRSAVPWFRLTRDADLGLRGVKHDDLFIYGDGVRRQTHLRGSHAVAVTGTRCATAASSSSCFGGGASSRRWCSGVVSCSYGSDAASSCSLATSIATEDGERWRATVAARVLGISLLRDNYI
jgi:hypothetical protein